MSTNNFIKEYLFDGKIIRTDDNRLSVKFEDLVDILESFYLYKETKDYIND